MLLMLYDLDHALIGGLKNCKEAIVESLLSTGDKTLSFSWHQKNNIKISNEYYVRTGTDEFVVKENKKGSNGYRQIVAKLNLEEIESRTWKTFTASDCTAIQMANLALTDTGWICNSDIPATKLRNVSLTKVNSYQVFEKIMDAFTCEIKWDSISKIVYLKERVGEDKGAYFISGLNLVELADTADTYGFYTELIPIGADDLEITDINGGKNYLSNHQYSLKKKTLIWEDSSYTDAYALMEDAEYKLDEISKPKKTYQVKIIDLAKMRPGYDALSYSTGDTVSLIDSESGIRESQRITKTVEYLEEPDKNTCDISNTVLSFEEYQKKLFAAAECLSNITTDNGTVKGSSVDKIDISQIIGIEEFLSSDLKDLKVDYLYVRKSLGAVYAAIGEADLTSMTTTMLNVRNRADVTLGYITELHTDVQHGNYAKFHVVESDNIAAMEARFDNLAANYAEISTLMFGSASGNVLTTQFSNSVIALLGNATIKDAMIDSLNVNKIMAGDISTNRFRIVSDSGNMLLSDNTIQIKDGTRTRVQIGKDASNDYNMYVWDKGGNLMFDAAGLAAGGITRPIIRDDMISDNADIDASKIDIHSLFSEMNGSTETLYASKVMLDTASQTLNVAFESLSTSLSGLSGTVAGQGTALNIIQGQIDSKIWQQDINTATDVLSTQYSTLLQTVDGISSEVSSVRTLYDNAQIGISANATSYNQLSDKFSWIVTGGTSAASMVLSSSLYKLVAENIDLTGKVTFTSLDPLTQNKVDTALSNASSALTTADATKKATVTKVEVQYALGTTATTAPTSGWSTTAPTWANGQYMWQKTATTYGDGTQSTSAVTCISGAAGSTGAAGKGVSTIVAQYYLSTSSTAQAGGTWSDTMPAWASGTYIWTRSHATYTDGSTATTTAVLANAINSANTMASTANTTANTANANASSALAAANTANMSLANWTYASTTEIDGAKIRTGTITADKIAVASLEAITAKIGGFTIGSIYLANNTTTLAGAASSVYVGTNGISCGTGFKVTNAGIMTVRNGKITNSDGFYTLELVESSIKITGTIGDGYERTGFIIYNSYLKTLTKITSNGWTCGQSSDGSTYSDGGLFSTSIANRIVTVNGNIDVTGAVYASNWLRTYGATGWYSQTYGGGWYMTDSTYIRNYNSKHLLLSGHAYFGSTTYYVSNAGAAKFASAVIGSLTLSSNAVGSSTASLELTNSSYLICLSNNSFRPSISDTGGIILGSSSAKWGQIYSSVSTISTSDRNQKKNIEYLGKSEKAGKYERLYMKLNPCIYMFDNQSSDRVHSGFISQDVESTLSEVGLTPLDFAAFCKDEKMEIFTDSDGNEIEAAIPGQYEYSLRYEEFIALNTHMIQKSIRKLGSHEGRIQALQLQVNDLQFQLQEALLKLKQQYQTA